MNFGGYDYAGYIAMFGINNIQPFPKCVTRDEFKPLPGKRIYLRHDVDSNYKASVKMAEIEAKMRIRSTYFILHYSDYWDKPETWKRWLELQGMGHEIAFHNAVLTEIVKNHNIAPGFVFTDENRRRAKLLIKDYLAEMRSYGLKIRGTSAHGHPTTGTHNYGNGWIWKMWQKDLPGFKQFDLADFGLEYDAMLCHRSLYHSDSGGEWHNKPDDVLKMFSAATDYTLQINVHPQHWD